MKVFFNSRTAACLAVFTSCAVATGAKAAVRLPAIFGDHMILQAEVAAPVFGWADPGQEVTVAFATQVKQSVADNDGRWIVRFEGLEPSCEGRSLVIETGGEPAKGDRLELKDVLVGEVWLASGQSHMAMNVYKAAAGFKAIENSRSNLVRVFRVGPAGISPLKPLDDCKGAWAPATPESVRDLSAAGYFFIRGLHDELNVPVGLISSAWGGTKCEAWTSRAAMCNNPVTRPTWEAFMASIQAFDPATATSPEEAKRWMDEYHAAQQKAIETKSRRLRLPPIVASPATKRYTPANFYNTMIHPLVPFGIRGVVWYQGESDRFEAERYQTAFPVMIADWRNRWERPDMPFYFVQLANIKASREKLGESVWAQQQWAQLLAHRNTPNTGIAVINDGSDVTLHPKHRKVVGDRLLCWALAKTYGRNDIAYTGPIYKRFECEGDDFYLFCCPWDPAIDDAYQHRTYVVMSDNPFDFYGRQPVTELEGHAPEIFHDVNGDWYISSVEWPHRGVSIAPLDWKLRELDDASAPRHGRSAGRKKRSGDGQ